MTTETNILTPDILNNIPHEDIVLFKRIREWLSDDNNINQLGREQALYVTSLLRDLKTHKIILTFTPAYADEQDDAVTHTNFRPTLDGNGHIIELHRLTSLQYGENKTIIKPIEDDTLKFVALDLIAVYRGLRKISRAPSSPDFSTAKL